MKKLMYLIVCLPAIVGVAFGASIFDSVTGATADQGYFYVAYPGTYPAGSPYNTTSASFTLINPTDIGYVGLVLTNNLAVVSNAGTSNESLTPTDVTSSSGSFTVSISSTAGGSTVSGLSVVLSNSLVPYTPNANPNAPETMATFATGAVLGPGTYWVNLTDANSQTTATIAWGSTSTITGPGVSGGSWYDPVDGLNSNSGGAYMMELGTAIPEPTTGALGLAGFAALTILFRRRRGSAS